MIKYCITGKKDNVKLMDLIFYDRKLAKQFVKALKKNKQINVVEVI